jgi:hypothetical protein
MKRDIINEVYEALKKYWFKNLFITNQLGVDQKIVDIIIEHAKAVKDKRIGLR